MITAYPVPSRESFDFTLTGRRREALYQKNILGLGTFFHLRHPHTCQEYSGSQEKRVLSLELQPMAKWVS